MDKTLKPFQAFTGFIFSRKDSSLQRKLYENTSCLAAFEMNHV